MSGGDLPHTAPPLPTGIGYTKLIETDVPGMETAESVVCTRAARKVAPFDENHPAYYTCGIHIKTAAKICALMGFIALSLILGMAIYVYLLDLHLHLLDTKKHERLFWTFLYVLYFAVGYIMHYHVLLGIKKTTPAYLTLFIIVYFLMIACEAFFLACAFMIPMSHPRSSFDLVRVPYQFENQRGSFFTLRRIYPTIQNMTSRAFLLLVLCCLTVIGTQLAMLLTVIRCKRYLGRKYLHQLDTAINEQGEVPFDESDYRILCFTARKAAKVSAVLGLTTALVIILIGIYIIPWDQLFETDLIFLISALVFILLLGILCNLLVLNGIARSFPNRLLPFIAGSAVLVMCETAFVINYAYEKNLRDAGDILCPLIVFLVYVIIVGAQAFAILSVARCRDMLIRRNFHDIQKLQARHFQYLMMRHNLFLAQNMNPTAFAKREEQFAAEKRPLVQMSTSPPPGYEP